MDICENKLYQSSGDKSYMRSISWHLCIYVLYSIGSRQVTELGMKYISIVWDDNKVEHQFFRKIVQKPRILQAWYTVHTEIMHAKECKVK